MSNGHGPKFIIQAGLGLVFMTLGIFLMVYGCLGVHQQKEWLFWGIVSCISINTAILFIISATVHKVKADLLKKRSGRRRESAENED